MNYIFYQTKTKFINTGDALINKALLDLLRDYGTLRCNCSREIPDYFIDELGIRKDEKIISNGEISFVFNIIKQKLKNKKEDKIFVFSGLGHHFGKSPKKIIRNIIAGFFIFPIYRILGVKIIRIGFSLGPVSKLLGISEKIRSIPVNGYYVRDEASLELCRKLGIKKAMFCPDMSWIYLMKEPRKVNDSNIITVCLRDSMFDIEDNEYRDNLESKLDIILNKINKQNKNIKIVFAFQVAEDKDFTFHLYNKYNNKYECEFIENQISLETAGNLYGKAAFNISNRMHSILLSYKYGCLPIVTTDLKKHKKISQTLEDSNFNEIGIDIYESNDNKIEYLIKNKEQILNKIFKIEQENQRETVKILNKIFDLNGDKA